MSAFLLMVAPSVAGEITYDLADYPSLQSDSYSMGNHNVISDGGTDHVVGTITTDGAMGPLSGNDILASTLALVSPSGTYAPAQQDISYLQGL